MRRSPTASVADPFGGRGLRAIAGRAKANANARRGKTWRDEVCAEQHSGNIKEAEY